MTTIEKVLFLKRVSIFAALPGEELAEIALVAEEVEQAAGDEIIREGEVDNSLFVLVSGRIRVMKGQQTLVELGEGEVVGELAVLDPAPRNATVTAVSDVTLLRIDGEAFAEIMREKYEIAEGITRVLARRLRAVGG
jgi:CRP-like cAMP-binding protein